jgi:hypothetical protein
MFQEVYFCTVVIKINFLEHKEHRNYNYKEQYKNKLPGT